MKIVLSPDPSLREVCEPVVTIDKSVKKLASNMAKIMYKNNGCGLAAPQVGEHCRVVVIDCDVENEKQNPITLINPQIIEHSEQTAVCDEGCLSVPGVSFPIKRYTQVKVKALDLEGEEFIIEGGEDLLGRCLQHEIDHLDGITMFERLDPIKRIDALVEYQAALARGAKPGDVGEN